MGENATPRREATPVTAAHCDLCDEWRKGYNVAVANGHIIPARFFDRKIAAHELAHRLDAASKPGLDEMARAFIHVRGAHNPTADELDGDQEVRPCAWCRLAAEQAIEAIARLSGDKAGTGEPVR